MSRLSELQRRILEIVATDPNAWRLTGGGALAGYHLGHRVTYDLDLFLGGRHTFDHEPRAIVSRLVSEGLACSTVQSSPGFVRLEVSLDGDAMMVDLVAEPVPLIEAPVRRAPGVLVDTPHEILVNKLTALLSRAEVRDLVDVQALVDAGCDLERALRDAPKKDGAFSPATLAWVLERFPLSMAPSLGFDRAALTDARDALVTRLLSTP